MILFSKFPLKNKLSVLCIERFNYIYGFEMNCCGECPVVVMAARFVLPKISIVVRKFRELWRAGMLDSLEGFWQDFRCCPSLRYMCNMMMMDEWWMSRLKSIYDAMTSDIHIRFCLSRCVSVWKTPVWCLMMFHMQSDSSSSSSSNDDADVFGARCCCCCSCGAWRLRKTAATPPPLVPNTLSQLHMSVMPTCQRTNLHTDAITLSSSSSSSSSIPSAHQLIKYLSLFHMLRVCQAQNTKRAAKHISNIRVYGAFWSGRNKFHAAARLSHAAIQTQCANLFNVEKKPLLSNNYTSKMKNTKKKWRKKQTRAMRVCVVTLCKVTLCSERAWWFSVWWCDAIYAMWCARAELESTYL